MNISVNGTPVYSQHEYCNNLEELLVEISKNSLPANHLIGNVKVNDREFSEVYPHQARDMDLGKVQKIDIGTVSIDKLAEAGLKDAGTFLGQIVESVNKTAELFRMYDQSEAYTNYANLIEALRSFILFIDAAKQAINWDFDMAMHQGKPLQRYWEELIEVINNMKTTQDEEDLILLADMLEYELAPVLAKWADIIRNMSSS